MTQLGTLLSAFAIIGLSSGGTGSASPVKEGDTLWVNVCGQPGMRVAIPIGGDENKNRRGDCPGGCHAATCRKTGVDARKGKAGGAVV